MRFGGAGGFVPTGDITGQTPGTLLGSSGGYVLDLAVLGIALPPDRGTLARTRLSTSTTSGPTIFTAARFPATPSTTRCKPSWT